MKRVCGSARVKSIETTQKIQSDLYLSFFEKYMKIKTFFSTFLLLFFGACSTPIPAPVAVAPSQKTISYLKDVKPILDKRCVVCHSCYNSPCQAKYSSFEGVDRGASKLKVYDATRLSAAEPTRLFIDATSTQEWRAKKFFSLTKSSDSNATHNDSIMMHLLYDKKMHPEVIGQYAPETDKLVCPRNKEELGEYFEDKPNHGMPYGFPAIKEKEYETLASWLQQGAHGPTNAEQKALETPSKNAALEIQKWEQFFNEDDAKHKMTARYLYEHLYLSHIYFPSAKGEFYELIRSYTPSGVKPQNIPTLRPFDDPKVDIFYYRLKKIHSTIVHKTHMTFKFDDAVLSRLNELFIKPKWMSTPKVESYETKLSANPFRVFEQIPAKSRYQFLLDNSHYIIQTFIRGPVCRGQMALNVIQDHFWIMFKDPEYDIGVNHQELIKKEFNNLAMPIEQTDGSVFKVFSDKYREKYRAYYNAKREVMKADKARGQSIESIWKGNKPSDAPLLTIYRHFDSASVLKGVVGEEPRTMWVIDYAQLERIYYNLVAGYDVFGNVTHQTNVRRYMDFLRLEGEGNFLDYMPKQKRLKMLKSCYLNADLDVSTEKLPYLVESKTDIKYKSDFPKNEFIEDVVNNHILKSTGIKFDKINYYRPEQRAPKMPKEYKSYQDFLDGSRAASQAGSGFISSITEKSVNNIFLRIDFEDGSHIVKNLIVNRWHDNVNSLFGEDDRLDPSKDTLDIVDFNVGSYPNAFVVVKSTDMADFLDMMKNMDRSHESVVRLSKYFVSRSDNNFWEVYDWFQNYLYTTDPINAGLYDLNRYAPRAWSQEEMNTWK